MKHIKTALKASMTAVLSILAVAQAAPTDEIYTLGPDSMANPKAPHGQVRGPTTLPSNVYPDTFRNYYVYVPAQYDAATPARLMIFFDGHAFLNTDGEYRIPNVFDNLIYRREMPVTLGVFINPGHSTTQPESTDQEWGDRTNNRRVEYNALDDKHSKLIIDELLPALQSQYNISPKPEDRALAGASSGAICAFNVAWHRPDQFGKVITTIGSFTNIMGGDAYPDMIREAEAKPIRVFLEDGLNDNRGVRQQTGAYDPRRDWHYQNIRMVEALTARKYDVNYSWGLGTHSNVHAGAIMPEMLRWLWRDYPRVDDPKDASTRGFLAPTTQKK